MLDHDEKLRYKRQLIMPEIGEDGQLKLKQAKVLVVGAGGLGSSALYYLAAMGIGKLGVIDADNVELSNLQRQILHNVERIGINKAQSAKETLEKLNPLIQIIEYPFEITEENAGYLIADYDVVVTALDNLHSRHLVNKICVNLNKPLVEAGVLGWEGLVTTIIPGKSPCYNCILSSIPNENRAEAGMVGCLPGILGAIQAMEVIKLILGLGNTLANRLLVFDGLELTFNEIKVEKNINCPVCGSK